MSLKVNNANGNNNLVTSNGGPSNNDKNSGSTADDRNTHHLNSSKRGVSPPAKKNHDRPYSPYNLYYILEHRLLLQEKGVDPNEERDDFVPSTYYHGLVVPPLPPRYASITVPKYWYAHGKKRTKRRAHRKTHGAVGFTELSKIMAANWKTIDDVTYKYVKDLSEELFRRWEIEQIEKEEAEEEAKNLGMQEPLSECSVAAVENHGVEEPNRLCDGRQHALVDRCAKKPYYCHQTAQPPRMPSASVMPSRISCIPHTQVSAPAANPVNSYFTRHGVSGVERYNTLRQEVANLRAFTLMQAEQLRQQESQLRMLGVQQEEDKQNVPVVEHSSADEFEVTAGLLALRASLPSKAREGP